MNKRVRLQAVKKDPISNKLMRKVVKVRFTTNEMLDAQDAPYMDTHRDFIQMLFGKKGYVVVDWSKIKFFWGKDFCVVEGTANEGLLSK
jgi:hypothetical protein